MPFCLPGFNKQKGATIPVEWHRSGILAYAVENTLVFVDVKSLKILQTLTKHRNTVTQLSWHPSIDLNDNRLWIASGDSSGQIFVWDVLNGQVLATVTTHGQPQKIEWLPHEDSNNKNPYLLVLSPKNLLTLWNVLEATQVWSFKPSTNLLNFTLDPFNLSRVIFSSTNSSLAFLDTFSTTNPPSGDLVLTHLIPHEKSHLSQIHQLQFHRAYLDRLFVLLEDQLLLLHTEVKAVLYNFPFTPGTAITKVFPCSLRDAFYSIQSNGQIILRVGNVHEVGQNGRSNLIYDKACSSEVHRVTSKTSVLGTALWDLSESHLAVITNSGSLIVNQLISDKDDEGYDLNLADHISFDEDLQNDFSGIHLSQLSYIKAFGSGMSSIKVRPMNVVNGTRSDLDNDLIAAVSTVNGAVYLVNIMSCEVIREFQVHQCAIKCLEWGGSDIVITAGYSAYLSSTNVRNDLLATNVLTGQKQRIRPEAEESPIELIKVSHYHCYLAVSFRRDPLEIWDLRSMRLLRRMSKSCPVIVDINWFGRHMKSTQEDNTVIRENLVVLDVDNHLYHVVVKGLHVRDGKEVSTDWSKNMSALTKVVWKDDYLVFGEVNGGLRVWDLKVKQNRILKDESQSRGAVMKLVFSSLACDYTLTVQHPSYVVIWDVESSQLLQIIQVPNQGISDVDMCGVTPIYLSSEGALRYGTLGEHLCASVGDNCISPELKMYINTDVKVYNDSEDCLKNLILSGLKDLHELVKSQQSKSLLPPYLHMFWSAKMAKKRLEDDISLLGNNCESMHCVDYVVERAVVLNRYDWANGVLLNLGHVRDADGSRSNAFKACLLTAQLQEEECKCVIKMVATNLIASSCISDGIQLLYMIGQREEACKYLLSDGRFSSSYSYLMLEDNPDDEILLRCLSRIRTGIISPKVTQLLFHFSKNNISKAKDELARLGLPSLEWLLDDSEVEETSA